MFTIGTRTCTDIDYSSLKPGVNISKSHSADHRGPAEVSLKMNGSPANNISGTTLSPSWNGTLNSVYTNVLTQVKAVKNTNTRSPLLHRRYKNFDGISGVDDSRIKYLDSLEQFKRAILHHHDSLVCVTFSAKWCGPWRMIKPDVHRLSHIHGDVVFYEVDVDDNEEIALSRRVICMPTFQFFKSGYMLDKFAEPNRIKLDETIRKLRRIEVKNDDWRFEQLM